MIMEVIGWCLCRHWYVEWPLLCGRDGKRRTVPCPKEDGLTLKSPSLLVRGFRAWPKLHGVLQGIEPLLWSVQSGCGSKCVPPMQITPSYHRSDHTLVLPSCLADHTSLSLHRLWKMVRIPSWMNCHPKYTRLATMALRLWLQVPNIARDYDWISPALFLDKSRPCALLRGTLISISLCSLSAPCVCDACKMSFHTTIELTACVGTVHTYPVELMDGPVSMHKSPLLSCLLL